MPHRCSGISPKGRYNGKNTGRAVIRIRRQVNEQQAAPPGTRPAAVALARIRIADFPQLRLIAWNRDPNDLIEPGEALALYERNWRHVDAPRLDQREKELIDRLVRTVGNGILHV